MYEPKSQFQQGVIKTCCNVSLFSYHPVRARFGT